VIDLRSVKEAHRRFLAHHDALLSQELRRAAEVGVVEVQRNPQFKPRTGALQKATQGKVIRRRNGSVVRLQNRKAYAAPIDKGAKPHVIRARRKKALRFVGRGGVVFRRSVNHPGNKPYRFLSRARDAASDSFGERMRAGMARIARAF
jgi:hypothetical protein